MSQVSEDLTKYLVKNYAYINMFLLEIKERVRQARYFNEKINEQLEQLEQLEQDFGSFDVYLFWTNLYAMTNSVAQISLILKNTQHPQTRERSESLRTFLGIKNDHKILDRSLRNRFVHIDEDIEEWWRKSKEKNVFRKSVIRGSVRGLENAEMFEVFYPDDGIIFYRGKKFVLQDFSTAIEDVENRVVLGMKNLRRLMSQNYANR